MLNASRRFALAAFLGLAVTGSPAVALGLDEDDRQALQDTDIGPIQTDLHTGVALGGFDPVEFIVSKRTVPGNPALQVSMRSASVRSTFYFRSLANRDAFLQTPDVYIPRFGGYCAMQLARGRQVSANPRIWAVYRNRLFLFHSARLRDEWLEAPGGYATGAEANWHPLRGLRHTRRSIDPVS